uniref:Ig-like domain-containing protein n=1 Tax=Serinus canaria TaxID=9135 RepID=A0A8C9MTI5_SERCA
SNKNLILSLQIYEGLGHTELRAMSVFQRHNLENRPTVQEGNEVTLKCNMERGDMSRYYMYWYRQGPRGKEWISTDGSTYEGFKDRFKARLESSKNSYPLQILAAEPGDAAVYYCRADPPWSSSAAE